jgi:hypothetical protein
MEFSMAGSIALKWLFHRKNDTCLTYERKVQQYIHLEKSIATPNFFSLFKIVRLECSIIGRNLLRIWQECFKLNHWHIQRHTYYAASVDDTLHFVNILIYILKGYLKSKFQYTLTIFKQRVYVLLAEIYSKFDRNASNWIIGT